MVGLVALPAFADTKYTVRRGDSVSAIANRVGVPCRAILEANGLNKDSVLHPGQELVIPEETAAEKTACPAAPRNLVHVIRRGETLSKIARRYGVSVRALAEENGIARPNRIYAGRTLRIPTGASKAQSSGQQETTPSDLVGTALRYRGVPYRYAGMTTRGMDCSGLVVRVLLTHGIRAPHSSRQLYRLGKGVPVDELRPGDLVFFNTRGRGISHVGIYMGDGKFVHASSSGGKVEVDRLDTGYYQKRLVGARRVS